MLKVNKHTQWNLISPLLESKDPLLLIEQRFLNFFIKILNHNNKFLKYIANFSLSNNFSYININIMSIIHKYSISQEKLYCNESITIRDNIAPNWMFPIIYELISTKNKLLNVNLNDGEIQTLLLYLCVN